ncbi:hypothetical protein CEP52_008777 [Fusarium oligoseptatum]|uniref:WDR36/Utp21 C-terminal domain-containing protein n=1 Tax=Fusarium oligoseptatum TaxID=2604345 RepID=A0A428TFZ3_9HYPO|nr:hypothetical protein CEP52_008777 [Fusarium oligoseptatum]
MSVTGEYLAATIQDELGVTLWTNKALFKHVPTRQISEKEIGQVALPTVSGENNEGMLEGAFEEDQDEEDDTVVAPTIEQLSSELTTLSLARKNILAPKQQAEVEDDGKSRITKVEKARFEEVLSSKLQAGAATGTYDEFIEHLKSLSPSSADLELRSLSIGDGNEGSNELLHFIRALTARLKARRDYELTQAWMTVFLKLHFDVVMESEDLLAALSEWKEYQEKECSRLDGLVGYCSGVVTFLRNPRT